MGIRIMLADDHALVREALRQLLSKENDIDVVDEAGNGEEVLERCGRSKPDIVVMDISMGKPDGIEITKRLLYRHPRIKVIALSCHTDKSKVVRMLEAGASGYVVKASAAKALLNAIRTVHSNRTYLCQEVADALRESVCDQRKGTGAALGRREIEVLTLLAEGKHAPEIGDSLHITASTVEAHRRNIMRKLELHNIVELTKYALREGLIEL